MIDQGASSWRGLGEPGELVAGDVLGRAGGLAGDELEVVARRDLEPATQVRCSASAIGYNLCLGLFGGTTPLVATYLVQRTADDFVPAYYLMATAVISLVATFRLPETAQKPLPV